MAIQLFVDLSGSSKRPVLLDPPLRAVYAEKIGGQTMKPAERVSERDSTWVIVWYTYTVTERRLRDDEVYFDCEFDYIFFRHSVEVEYFGRARSRDKCIWLEHPDNWLSWTRELNLPSTF